VDSFTFYVDDDHDEVTAGWRKLHNEDLHNLYSSPIIIRFIKSGRMMWAGHVARMGEKRIVYRLLIGKTDGKRPLGRPRRRWMDNIKMDFRDRIECCGLDWSGSGQVQLVSSCERGNEIWGSIKCWWLHNVWPQVNRFS
jgi:hypothetical protein